MPHARIVTKRCTACCDAVGACQGLVLTARAPELDLRRTCRKRELLQSGIGATATVAGRGEFMYCCVLALAFLLPRSMSHMSAMKSTDCSSCSRLVRHARVLEGAHAQAQSVRQSVSSAYHRHTMLLDRGHLTLPDPFYKIGVCSEAVPGYRSKVDVRFIKKHVYDTVHTAHNTGSTEPPRTTLAFIQACHT